MARDQFNKPNQNRPQTGKQQNDGCVRVIVIPAVLLIALVVMLVF